MDNYIDQFNERRWWERPVQLKVEVDTSRVGFGGVISSENQERIEVRGTLTKAQIEQSSTARELRGYKGALEVITQKILERIQGSSVLLLGDNQGAVSALRNLRSSVPEMHLTVQHIFQLCTEFDFDIVARWIPRENLTEADELSRQPDAADWGLASSIVTEIWH
jgi:hypothetical protein